MNNKIKISQLQLETNLKEDALIPIVQDNKTKAIKSRDLLKDYKDLNKKINSVNEQLDNIEKKVDDHIVNHPQGGGETSIDDNTISTKKTWSSAKIEDFVHTNDDVVWSTVQGENLSIEYTKEGYLREVEIWGDTWQDSDSKNLLDPTIIRPGFINNDGSITAIENNWSTQNWRYSDYIKGLKEGQTYCLSGELVGDLVGNHGFIFGFYDSKETLIQRAGRATSHNSGSRRYDTIIVPTGTVYTRIAFTVNDTDGVRMTKLMLEESSGVTDYVDYHKADLSDIRHLGELYVDEKGQPILDSEGREQYKIEISSLDGFNIYKDGLIEVNKNGLYHFGWIKNGIQNGNWHVFTINTYDNNREFIEQIYQKNTGEDDIEIPDNCSFIEIKSGHGGETFLIEKSFWDKRSAIKNIFAKQNNAFKTTLLLPCQLMKVGNVADRLYWNSEKKKYLVEKNIGVIYPTCPWWNNGNWDETSVNIACTIASGSYIVDDSKEKYINNYGFVYNSTYDLQNNGKLGIDYYDYLNETRIQIRGLKSELGNTLEEVQNTFDKKTFVAYGVYKTPQLIETNISEQILLPSYKDKTHLFVNGGIDGGIKAKVPLNGGQAIQSLSARNVALNEEVSTLSLENEELKQMDNELVAISWDMDFRMCEVEWTLEDLGIGQEVTTLSLEENNNIKNVKGSVSNMALTRFEQAKIMIIGGVYKKETLTKQLTTYLNRGYLTQEEYDELIALMEAKVLVVEV